MKLKAFIIIVLIVCLGVVGCGGDTTIKTSLGEGKYQTLLNARGKQLDGQLFLLVESSEEAITEENLLEFYDEVIKDATIEDYHLGVIKCGDYGLSFSPGNMYLTWGKIKKDVGNLLENTRLESIEKYVVIEDGKVTESNGD